MRTWSAAIAIVALLCGCAELVGCSVADFENDDRINRFRNYTRIDTSHPLDGSDVNYTPATTFLIGLATDLGLSYEIIEDYPGKPILVMTLNGTDPSLPSIMLNSHMDVVYASMDQGWLYDPFAADMDENGDIYGRGTQDMKCNALWYLETIRKIKENNITLLRTLHVTFVPDEEIGSTYGMKHFATTERFRELNVGLCFDEGAAYPLATPLVFYGERTPLQINVTCYGPGGHSSTMPNETATNKLRVVIDKLLDLRNEQFEAGAADPSNISGNQTSINLTKLQGGTANNVIPSVVSAVFDFRLGVEENATEFKEMIQSYCDIADCNFTYIMEDPASPPTALDNTWYWDAITNATDALGLTLLPIIAPGNTDERFVRPLGIPALGFSPMPNTTTLLHSTNERINAQIFLNGIDYYFNILLNVANTGSGDDASGGGDDSGDAGGASGGGAHRPRPRPRPRPHPRPPHHQGYLNEI